MLEGLSWLAIGMEVPPNISGTPKYEGPPSKNGQTGTPNIWSPQFSLKFGRSPQI